MTPTVAISRTDGPHRLRDRNLPRWIAANLDEECRFEILDNRLGVTRVEIDRRWRLYRIDSNGQRIFAPCNQAFANRVRYAIASIEVENAA